MNDRPIGDIIYDPTPTLLDPPYRKSDIAANEWKEVRGLLEKLRDEGKLTFTADDEETPYELHTFQVHWIFNDTGDCELEAKRVAEILSRVTTLITDEKDSSWWQLSRKIYIPSDD